MPERPLPAPAPSLLPGTRPAAGGRLTIGERERVCGRELWSGMRCPHCDAATGPPAAHRIVGFCGRCGGMINPDRPDDDSPLPIAGYAVDRNGDTLTVREGMAYRTGRADRIAVRTFAVLPLLGVGAAVVADLPLALRIAMAIASLLVAYQLLLAGFNERRLVAGPSGLRRTAGPLPEWGGFAVDASDVRQFTLQKARADSRGRPLWRLRLLTCEGRVHSVHGPVSDPHTLRHLARLLLEAMGLDESAHLDDWPLAGRPKAEADAAADQSARKS